MRARYIYIAVRGASLFMAEPRRSFREDWDAIQHRRADSRYLAEPSRYGFVQRTTFPTSSLSLSLYALQLSDIFFGWCLFLIYSRLYIYICMGWALYIIYTRAALPARRAHLHADGTRGVGPYRLYIADVYIHVAREFLRSIYVIYIYIPFERSEELRRGIEL